MTRPSSINPHILVVDDDAAVGEALTALLAFEYIVHTAATGADACACLRTHPIAAIILDALLREEHGLAFVQPFRTIRAVPIILLTGHSSEELAIRAIRHQVADYFKKPGDIPNLLASLKRLVVPTAQPLDVVARARQSLETYVAKPFHAERFARELGVSEPHLRWLFRQAYGITPHQYLRDIRLTRAATLLRTSDLGVDRIASDVGYPDVTWFTKVFKRAFGMPPAAYRAAPRANRA